MSTKTVILEIHPASGGEDAARFAAQLMEAYTRAARRRGWLIEPVSGGQERFVSVRIDGSGVGVLFGEVGAHRITHEVAGVRHTSIASVAVLEPTRAAVSLDRADLRVELMRAGGHGGQNVNRRETAVRITHIPTGISAHIADERYQGRNRDIALERVEARVASLGARVEAAKTDSVRAAQVGRGEFAERRRTYNARTGTAVDHRSGARARLSDVLSGDFGPLWREDR